MIDDIKLYEFLLKLGTYLSRTNVLAEKFASQEKELGERILYAKHTIPDKEFNAIFSPIAHLFEKRLKLMGEIREANNEFEDTIKEFYESFRGIVQ